MAKKKKNKNLGNVLQRGLQTPFAYEPPYDVRDDAENREESAEPIEKVLVFIQNLLINGEYEAASALISQLRYGRKKGTFFSYHHLNQLVNWVRNIYKYTNMKDINFNYYDHNLTKEMGIPEMGDLKKVKVKEEHIEKFMKDAKKVLEKKMTAR